MNIIVEGLDSSGKSTLIKSLQSYLYNLEKIYPTQTLYYYNFKVPADKILQVSRMHYHAGFKTLIKSYHEDKHHLLLDRFHLGEYVYAEKYRGYDGSYVFYDELDFVEKLKDNTLLVLLYDTAENLIARDDGESLSVNIDDKNEEIQRFLQAFELTKLSNKTKININNKSLEDVYNLVITEVKKLKGFG